jgi:integrase
VTPAFGDVLVANIDKAAVTRWLNALRTQPRQRRRGNRTEGVSESTVNNALTALRVVLRRANDEGYIDRNPVDELPKRARPKPGSDSREVRVLDESELARLFAAAADPFALMFRVKAYSGLRGSELRGLIWGDLDLDAGRATITRQLDDQDKGERVALKSKTLRERRTVPLIAELVEPLRDRLAMEQEHGRGNPGDWVFNIDGQHISYPTFAYRFECAVTGAGLDPGPDLTPHSLRHTFGSMMLAFGHPLVTVSAWLGHTRTSTTERAYLHQIESMHDQAGDLMRAQMDARKTVNATVNTEPVPVAPAESPTVPGVRS